MHRPREGPQLYDRSPQSPPGGSSGTAASNDLHNRRSCRVFKLERRALNIIILLVIGPMFPSLQNLLVKVPAFNARPRRGGRWSCLTSSGDRCQGLRNGVEPGAAGGHERALHRCCGRGEMGPAGRGVRALRGWGTRSRRPGRCPRSRGGGAGVRHRLLLGVARPAGATMVAAGLPASSWPPREGCKASSARSRWSKGTQRWFCWRADVTTSW